MQTLPIVILIFLSEKVTGNDEFSMFHVEIYHLRYEYKKKAPAAGTVLRNASALVAF